MKKLVRFEDGRYGVYVGKDKFQDLIHPEFTWHMRDDFFERTCKGSKELAKKIYDSRGTKYEVVESDSIFDALKAWIMRQLQKEPTR